MILVTGGGGLVGLNLARELADGGHEVLLLSWFHDRYKVIHLHFSVPSRVRK